MKRYFIELSYFGKNYHGWQIQPDAISVQEMLNKGFSKILNCSIKVNGAGRTDTGVHASQMFAHIDTDVLLDQPEYLYKINSVLPDDIVVAAIFQVDDEAHTRFSAISRSYEYQIYLGRNAFLLDTTWQLHSQLLDIDKMNKAAAVLLNYSNFKCFSKSKTEVKTYNCKVSQAEWKLEGETLTFYITADRFLRNMVRAIVGTLVAVGKGKVTISEFVTIIENQDRRNAGTSAPARGLFLTSVVYPNTIRYE
ncbi:tRNA pseudouridine(38-40) synthase TruA [Flavicella sediminum]|uniref:tRNA pseudouridine(38-40) synthase TruA n=1 Tax=Flavicella sediminum TaxID=2585141 RepID=UPI00111D883E|nr:tRNA pseudouridine(38-40) synthase TruA [Flavicella sediminum]